MVIGLLSLVVFYAKKNPAGSQVRCDKTETQLMHRVLSNPVVNSRQEVLTVRFMSHIHIIIKLHTSKNSTSQNGLIWFTRVPKSYAVCNRISPILVFNNRICWRFNSNRIHIRKLFKLQIVSIEFRIEAFIAAANRVMRRIFINGTIIKRKSKNTQRIGGSVTSRR